jgi:hypothetical protein
MPDSLKDGVHVPSHPLDDGPPEPLRPGELSGAPTAGDYAALMREVRVLTTTLRESFMPLLNKTVLESAAIRKEMSGFLSAIHAQDYEIDTLRKTNADLAVAHDAARHLITERVSRTELAITELRGKLEASATSVPRVKPAKRRAR